MDRDLNRREFLAIGAGSLAAACVPRPPCAAPRRLCTSVVFITLQGGVPHSDFWDPKEFTPFRPGMRGCDLLCTCPSIPTAARSIRVGAGLEQLAAVMDRGLVVRSLHTRGPASMQHQSAIETLRAGVAAFSANSSEPGRRSEPDGAEVGPFLSGVGDRTDWQFAAELERALRSVEAGERAISVRFPYVPRGMFDAHDHGAQRSIEMKRRVDGPLAAFVLALESRGLLPRTLVVIASEFGRTIAPARRFGVLDPAAERTGSDLIIRSDRDFGFHGHFSSAHSVLLFGGPVIGGRVIGSTAPVHPMVVSSDPVSLHDLFATISLAVGSPGMFTAGSVVPGVFRGHEPSTVHA